MTASERIRYQKLPGRRRGIFQGSSVWQGPDHLLLVRSWRFREDYKRFYLGDIQSIAIADAPRFHISTRSLVIGLFWLILLSISFTMPREWPAWVMAGIGLALVGAWAYISAKCSCVCRIYTAVSGDDLPSVYRTWTARKFMRRVEVLIAGTQGAINGDWAEAVDARRIGPPEETGIVLPSAAAGAPPVDAQIASGRILPFAEVFVILMFVDAVFSYLVKVSAASWYNWVANATLAIELALVIAILIQHHRHRLHAGRRLRSGMQKLAIAYILVSGGMYYSRTFVTSFTAARARNRGARVAPAGPVDPIYRDLDIGAHLIWGLTGTVILLAQREKKPRGIMG